MTDLDDRARRAGAALRNWTPAPPAPSDVAAAAVRRTRRQRAAAGTALVGAVVAVGFLVGPGTPGQEVRTGPAVTAPRREVPRSTSTSTSSTSSTTSTTPTTAADPDAGPVPTTAPTASTAPPAPAPSGGCAGDAGGVAYELTPPAGWYANEAWEEVPACRYLAPEPVQLSRGESEAGSGAVVSNAAVWLWTSDILDGYSFEQSVADAAAREDVVDVRRATVDGRPAARFERVTTAGDDHPGGQRFVVWEIDLGDVALNVRAGSSAQAAQLDAIVQSLRFSI